MKTVLAFDFGASSGRAIKAAYYGDRIFYEEIHRFENIPIQSDGFCCHDVYTMMREVDRAIQKAEHIDALAFDTWGVDYGLLDENGRLVALPCHYRDARTQGAVARALAVMDADTLYRETGNQIMEINTLFQLLSDRNLNRARRILFMPDLFGYLLTGRMACEYSIASTSQMLDPYTKRWSEAVTDAFGISPELFPPLTRASTILGSYNGIDVISVAGHDTQCAVTAMPCRGKNAAFLSCGTWSLIGCELDAPVLTPQSNACELSNELGANGKINYLKNISGLWLIQKLRRELAQEGTRCSYNELEHMARRSKPFAALIDPDAPMLSSGDLREKIRAFCMATGQTPPETVGAFVRTIYESLALKYRYALEQITRCTGRQFEVLHMLGGGTKDGFLCQMAADCLGICVEAGPVEATSLGNIIYQLIALGELESAEHGRRIIAANEMIVTYMPHPSCAWERAYDRYKKIIEEK